MAQQVDIALGPGLRPDGLDHHGTSICRPGQPERDVIVDPHPAAAVRDPCPAIPGIKPVIVSEQDDEGHPAITRESGHFREQPAAQTAGPLALRHAQVDDAERPHDSVSHPDDPEFHAHLARHVPAAGRREIPEMRGQLEMAPAGILRKARLQQRLQLPPAIGVDLGLGDTAHRNGIVVHSRLAHISDFTR